MPNYAKRIFYSGLSLNQPRCSQIYLLEARGWGGEGGVVIGYIIIMILLGGPVQIAQLCHLYSVENLLEHNT